MKEKSFKKMLSIIMVLMLTFSVFTACGTKSSQSSSESNQTSQTSEQSKPIGEKVVLRFATPDPDESSITVAAKEFARIVKQKSNGTIEIVVHPNGTLYGGDPNAAVKQLSAGTLDMLVLSTVLCANFEPKFSVISIPYLFDNPDQVISYLNGDLGKQLLNSLDKMNIKGLTYWPRTFRQITNSKRPIQEPGDLKGLKIRVPNNPLWIEFFKASGATPVPMAFGEVYTALQLKTVDGQENPLDIPISSKFYEVQKYLTISDHMTDAWVVGINLDKFNKLSSEQKQILLDAAKEIQQWKLKYDIEEDKKAIKFLESQGMKANILTASQKEKFRTISKPLYPKFKELVKDPEFFDKTVKTIETLRTQGKAK